MRYTFCLIISFILVSGMTCKKDSETCHHTVLVDNSTDKPIYVGFTFGRADLYTEEFYHNIARSKSMYKFEPAGSQMDNSGIYLRGCFETSMRLRGQGELYLSILNAEKLESTSPKVLAKERYSLKEYELSIKELDKIGWKIKFTGE